MSDHKDKDTRQNVILEHMTMAHIETVVVKKQMTTRHIDRAVQQQHEAAKVESTVQNDHSSAQQSEKK